LNTEYSRLSAPADTNDRLWHKNRWRLIWVAAFVLLTAACSGGSPTHSASAVASVHSLGSSAPANATAPSSQKASPAVSATLSSPGKIQPTGQHSSQGTSPSASAPSPASVTVPDVLGLALSAARSALEAADVGPYSWVYGCYGSPDINEVVRQSPGGGAQVPRTTHVSMYLQADNC
jgi:hypothetical protein